MCIYLNFTVAMVTSKKLEISTCRGNSHFPLKYLFGICLCSMLVSLSNILNLLQNGQFFYFQPILAAVFVTITTVKVKVI